MAADINPSEKYQSPRRSRLEDHLALIKEMRRNGWPFALITRHLEQEHGLKVSAQAVWGFCRRRGMLHNKEADREPLPPPPPAGATAPPGAAPSSPSRVAGPADGLTMEERIKRNRRERAEREAKYHIETGYVPGKPLTLKPQPPARS